MEQKKKNLLKDLTVTSVDLCNQGANPEAHFVLKKSLDMQGGEKQFEAAPLEDAGNISQALYESITSIINDDTLSADAKADMFHKSIEECAEILKISSGNWLKGELYDDDSSELLAENEDKNKQGKKYKNKKLDKTIGSDGENMFETEKMTDEDKVLYETLKRKYSQEQKQETNNLHPEVKKAMDEVAKAREELEEVKKAFEISRIETVAKKYEIIGKKADELAPKLYELKKSGGTAHDDYMAMLDEMVAMQESTGILKEFGSNQSGMAVGKAKLDATISEIMKSDRGMSYAQAVVKACDEHPELKAEYEN